MPLISRLRNDWSLWLFPLLYALASWRAYGDLGLLDNAHIVGGLWSDPIQQTWFLSYWQWAVTHTHVATWTSLMDHPLGINLLDNTSFPLLGILFVPLTSAFGPVAVLGLLFRLALFLSSLSAYFVLRRLVPSRIGAGIGGLIYGFGPALAADGQNWMHLTFMPLPPLMLYLLYRGLTDNVHSWRNGLLLGGLTVIQCLIEAEVALETLLAGALTAVAFGAVSSMHGSIGMRELNRFVRIAGGFLAAALVPLLALSLLILDSRGSFHGRLFPVHSGGYAPVDTLLPNPTNYLSSLTGIKVPAYPFISSSSNGAYVGVPILLAFAATGFQLRAQAFVRVAVAFTLICWVLTLGNYLARMNETVTSIPLPFYLISRLPLGGSLDGARFVPFVDLGLAVVLAAGIAALIKSKRLLVGRLAGGAVIVLGIVLGAPASGLASDSVAKYAPFQAASTAVERHIPRGGVVLTLPYSNGGPIESLLWQALAGMRYEMLGGYAIRQLPPGYPAYGYPELSQAQVSCLLMAGPASTRGSTCQSVRAVRPQLRAFVRRWHVSAILVQVQRGDGTMLRFLDRLYRSHGRSGSMDVWTTGLRSP